MKINCLYDKLVPIKDLKSHPKNKNKHPEEQIVRLAQILDYQGWRYPVKVSRLTGFVTSGHGRIEAAKKNGWTEVPVNYQEYISEAQEYADVQADNAIATWAELDLESLKLDLKDFEEDFNLDLLGLKDLLNVELGETDPDEEWNDMPEFNQEDKSAYRTLHVHFQNDSDFAKFFSLIKQPFTEKIKTIWFPEIEENVLHDKGYVQD